MALGQDFDLKQMVLLNCSFGPQEIARINRCISSKYANFRIFHEAVNELESHEDEQSPAGMVRLGVCLYLLGKYRRSLTVLQHGDGGLARLVGGERHDVLRGRKRGIRRFLALCGPDHKLLHAKHFHQLSPARRGRG